MDTMVLNPIPFQLEVNDLLEKLHLKEGSTLLNDLKRLIDEAQKLGRPKAIYKAAFIDSKGDDFVMVEGIEFKSRVLRVNLDQTYRIFPFAVTCGTELEDWSDKISDVLQHYLAESIKESVLRIANDFLKKHLVEYYELGKVSRMSPGSLEDWPIEEQRPLFSLLGKTKDLIGVYLTESLMMVPIKSISGIWFPAETSFVSCQLCPRDLCPGRKAPYHKDLYDRKYRLK